MTNEYEVHVTEKSPKLGQKPSLNKQDISMSHQKS